MFSVLNTLLEYTSFYKPKNITSYTFWVVLKIVKSPQCLINRDCLEGQKLLLKNVTQ